MIGLINVRGSRPAHQGSGRHAVTCFHERNSGFEVCLGAHERDHAGTTGRRTEGPEVSGPLRCKASLLGKSVAVLCVNAVTASGCRMLLLCLCVAILASGAQAVSLFLFISFYFIFIFFLSHVVLDFWLVDFHLETRGCFFWLEIRSRTLGVSLVLWEGLRVRAGK